jgi:predicted SAM-dependent methyltransferase
MTRAVILAQDYLKTALFEQGLHRAEFKRAKKFLKPQDEFHVHLGCGSKIKSGWCNVDLHSTCADYRLDLREDWPFANDSVDTIYSEHFFEHLDYPTETSHYLNETRRTLRTGGILHIGVPGTGWLLTSYRDRKSRYWDRARECWHPNSCRTRMHHTNYHFRQNGQHKYAWDAETLLDTLAGHGFPNAVKRRWRADLDSPERRVNTIYVVARKL